MSLQPLRPRCTEPVCQMLGCKLYLQVTREGAEAPGGLEPGRHSRAKCPSRLRGLSNFTYPLFPLYLKFTVKFTLICIDKHLESWSPFYSWPEKSGPTPGCPVYPLPQPGRLQTSFPEVSHWGPAWEGHVQPSFWHLASCT